MFAVLEILTHNKSVIRVLILLRGEEIWLEVFKFDWELFSLIIGLGLGLKGTGKVKSCWVGWALIFKSKTENWAF